MRRAISEGGGRWADFGSGEGAFTLALRDLLGAESEIFSVDKDRGRLETQRRVFHARFPDSRIHFLQADLARPLDLPPLDGLVMANSLHFFRDQEEILRQLRAYLKEDGRFVLVEYNADSGNVWVPHPLSFETFRALALRAGFKEPQLLATIPSRFLREIYAALTFKSPVQARTNLPTKKETA